MKEYTPDDFIYSAKDGIKIFSEIQSNVDKVITTESGVTVIPVSKLTMGYVTGGVGFYDAKRESDRGSGGGGGTGISVSPIAFLTVGRDGEISLISLNDKESVAEKIVDLARSAPELIENIKNTFS